MFNDTVSDILLLATFVLVLVLFILAVARR